MSLSFRTVAMGIALSFCALALTLIVAPHLLLRNWGLEVSLAVGAMGRRTAALLGGIAVMVFLGRNAEPSAARSAMIKGLVTACLTLAALGSLELAVCNVAPGILVAVFVEIVFALALLHVARGQSESTRRRT
jgi:hypothetical protein